MRLRRIVTVALAAVLLCTTLSACMVDLDDMREHHAVRNEDGGITINDVIYLPFPMVDNAPDYISDVWDEAIVNLTEPDVPLLLSGLSYDYLKISKDRIFLTEWTYADYNLYCRESDYAAMLGEYNIRRGEYYANGTIKLGEHTYEPLKPASKADFDDAIWNMNDAAVLASPDAPWPEAAKGAMLVYCSFDRLLLCKAGTDAVYCRSDRYEEVKEKYRVRVGLFEEDGTITVEGVTYKKLKDVKRVTWYTASPALTPCYDAVIPVNVYDNTMIDNEPYHTMYMSSDGVLLECLYSKVDETKEGFYCREDYYDEMMRRVRSETVEYTHYAYSFDERFGYIDEATIVYRISEEGAAAIDAVLRSGTPVVGEGKLRNAPTMFLQRCTKDLFFVTSAGMAIVAEDGEYTLVEYGGDEILNYAVPEEYTAAFDAVTEHWLRSGNPTIENVMT